MTILLNLAYLAFLALVSPILLYRTIVHGKYRGGWGEKLLGRVPVRTSQRPCLWLHAVSVGEVLQLQTVVKELAAARPDVELVITTTTSTGLGVAKQKFPGLTVCYFPLDFTWAVRTAMARLRPSAIVLVELELWPNFILAANGAGVPLALINGRISEKSFRGYSRIRWLMRRLLPSFEFLAAQNDTYGERLKSLGAPAGRVHVTGSIKFDHVETRRDNPKTAELRRHFGIAEGERVFVAGSTQSPEEEYALRAWQSLRSEFPELRLVLVPRHKERFEEVAALVERLGLPLVRRSANPHAATGTFQASRPVETDENKKPNPQSPVLLLDTLGELSACWGLADVAFVGGSLTQRGGQNMIEPAGYGAAVLFGPNTWNFKDVVETLLAGDAARVVRGESELTETVAHLLRDRQEARELGARAQRLVLAQQGATARTLRLLHALLPAPDAAVGIETRAA